MKKCIAIAAAVCICGCAAAPKGGVAARQLQERIAHLEQELQIKNQEISLLENELEGARSGEVVTQKGALGDRRRLSTRQTQTALRNSGFYKGRIDGKSGPHTKEAIKNFQKAHGLSADGIAGKQTSEKLREYLF